MTIILDGTNGITYPDSTIQKTAFATGTAILFQQTAAPTYWTKVTSYNNYALRIVSGAVSTGGSVAFTSAFASQAVTGTNGGYTLTTTDIPAHNHGINDPGHAHGVYDPSHNHNQVTMQNTAGPVGGGGFAQGWANYNTPLYQGVSYSGTGISIAGAGTGISTQNTGSSGSHTHSFTGTAINLAVQYVDAIICTKN